MKGKVAAPQVTGQATKKIEGTAPPARGRPERESVQLKKRKRIFKVSTFHH
ncbi:hypothetical protein ACIBF1_18785 [Spirillospora sp. NPDC050679]